MFFAVDAKCFCWNCKKKKKKKSTIFFLLIQKNFHWPIFKRKILLDQPIFCWFKKYFSRWRIIPFRNFRILKLVSSENLKKSETVYKRSKTEPIYLYICCIFHAFALFKIRKLCSFKKIVRKFFFSFFLLMQKHLCNNYFVTYLFISFQKAPFSQNFLARWQFLFYEFIF